ncbi:MAG TPA: peptidoglycan DD-metalloendopeptidase family protein [Marinagarivorans sp.]
MNSRLLAVRFSLWFIVVIGLTSQNLQAAVYKYQDKHGRWQFSDRPPLDKSVQAETLVFKPTPENPRALKFDYRRDGEAYIAEVINPFYIAVEVKVTFATPPKNHRKLVVPSRGRALIYTGATPTPKFNYQYVWGSPKATTPLTSYQIPVRSSSKHKISQSFHGSFSHHQQPSLYAVDIALPIGTDIVAARAGTVVYVKDDYAFGGAHSYFLDKANSVSVLHEDGSYATYAHLLMGSVAVTAGQSVNAGDLLGQSGTSGFSTGPHLHFVVRKNAGFKTESIPFTFEHPNGNFTPQPKQIVCPC